MKGWSLGIWPLILNLFRSTNAPWPSLFRIACQIFKFWFYELISKLITHNSARNSSGGGIIGKLYWWWYFRIEVWTIHIPHNISTKCQVSVSLLRVLCIPGPERSPRGREIPRPVPGPRLEPVMHHSVSHDTDAGASPCHTLCHTRDRWCDPVTRMMRVMCRVLDKDLVFQWADGVIGITALLMTEYR